MTTSLVYSGFMLYKIVQRVQSRLYMTASVVYSFTSDKMTPCQIQTYTGISRDNPTCDLSRDIPV